eukprot:m.311011 g.311011  ORF g.311011 m.311011 type:complete len:219 (-) comp16481_c0_seq15:78-734(-)
MSDLIKEYEHDYNTLYNKVLKQCSEIPDMEEEQKNNQVKSAEKDIEEISDLIEQMSVEVTSLPASERAKVKAKVAKYKKESEDLEKKLRRAAVALSSNKARDELFEFDASTDDAREALLSNTERLNRTSNKIEDGQRAALEAQEVGMGIMSNLSTQRETIERSRNRLQEANSPLAKSMKILNRMKTRALANRMVTGAIILVVVITIVMVVILILTKNS